MPAADTAKDKQHKRFKKLSEEWRNDMMSRSREDLFKAVADAAIAIVASETAKQFDEDLARIKEELATANEGYKEVKETKSVQIEFLIETLRSQGVDVPSLQDVIAEAGKVKDPVVDAAKDAAKKAVASHAAVNKIVKDAASRISKSMSKGSSMTISVPSTGKSATIHGSGPSNPDYFSNPNPDEDHDEDVE